MAQLSALHSLVSNALEVVEFKLSKFWFRLVLTKYFDRCVKHICVWGG